MNKLQYALVRFSEEASEVGQAASKVICFKPNHTPPYHRTSNAERLREEFIQLLAMATKLEDLGLDMGLKGVNFPVEILEEMDKKRQKFEKYLTVSRKLGVDVVE
jgi:hypothetical protein